MNAIRAAYARFQHSSFAKDAAILTTGTLAAQLLSIAAMPIMSRLYSPADFGQYAVFAAVVGITATAITLRYEATILLPKEESESTNLTLLSLALALCLGVMLSVLACVAPEEIKKGLGINVLGNWFPFAVFTGIGSAVVAIGSNWFNRQRAYIKMTKHRVIQSSVAVTLGVGLGFGGNASGLIVAQSAALLVTSLIIMRQIRSLLRHWRSQATVNAARMHIAAPKFLLPTALLDVITMQLPVLLITAWFSSDSAGQFSMAWRILALPMSLIGGAVGLVFFQRFSKVWPDAHAAKKLLYKTWKTLAIFGLAPMFLVLFFGKSFLPWIFGDVWSDAGAMAVILAPMLFLSLIHSPTSTTFIILGMQKKMVFFGVSILIYRPLSFYIGYEFQNIYLALILYVLFEISQILVFQYLAIKKINLYIKDFK